MCALTPCGHPSPQLVTLRYSSWNRTGWLNILEKFLPKYHSTLQGIKLQTVFNKKVLLSYFLGRQSKSPGLSTFFPQGQAIKKNQVILISSYTSHLLESPWFVGGFYWCSRSRPKSITLTGVQKLLLMSHLAHCNTNQTRHCPSSCEPVLSHCPEQEIRVEELSACPALTPVWHPPASSLLLVIQPPHNIFLMNSSVPAKSHLSWLHSVCLACPFGFQVVFHFSAQIFMQLSCAKQYLRFLKVEVIAGQT